MVSRTRTRTAPGRGARIALGCGLTSTQAPCVFARRFNVRRAGVGARRTEIVGRQKDDRTTKAADRRTARAPHRTARGATARGHCLNGSPTRVRQPNGRPIDPRPGHRAWRALLRQADVGPARLHDARHTVANRHADPRRTTACRDAVLGHPQISLTLGTYSHVVPELAQDAALVSETRSGDDRLAAVASRVALPVERPVCIDATDASNAISLPSRCDSSARRAEPVTTHSQAASRAGPVLVPAGGAVELLGRFSMAGETASEGCMPEAHTEAHTPAGHHIGTRPVEQRRVAAHMRRSGRVGRQGLEP